MYESYREVRRYRAIMPREAWKHGREPRERRRKRDALDDLVGGLELERHEPNRSTIQWVVWAVQVGIAGNWSGPAPDDTEWRVVARIEVL
jgi:hypothetical protein